MAHYTDWPDYPTEVLNLTDYPTQTDDVDDVSAWLVNALVHEMIAVQDELGTQPKGSYADVKTRIDKIYNVPSLNGSLNITNFSDNTNLVKIHDDGIIDNPLQSGIKVWLSASQTLTHNSWNTIAFNIESWDLQSEFNTTTHTWTAKKAGKYLITLYLKSSNTHDCAWYIETRPNVNIYDHRRGRADRFIQTWSTIGNFSAGNTLYLRIYVYDYTDGSNVILTGGQIFYTNMTITKIL